MKKISRRNFMMSSSKAISSMVLLGSGFRSFASDLGDDNIYGDRPESTIAIDRHVVLHADEHFNTLPSISRLSDGKTMVVFRKAPDWQYRYGVTDIDHDSSIMSLTTDDGERWNGQAAVEVYADYLHGVDRPVIHVLQDGSLFCTFLMWQVEEKTPENKNNGIQIFDNWIGFIKGAYSIRSTDGGKSWDEPVALPGPDAIGRESVELADGSVLCCSYSENITIYKTNDKGLTWTTLSTIPKPTGYFMTEPTLYKTDSGRIVCYAKGVPDTGRGKQTRLMTAVSADGGVTWAHAQVRKVDYTGSSHLLRLNDNAVLLTYKYCHGTSVEIRGAVLNAECTNVDQVAHDVLRRDGLGVEAGNTSAIMLDASKFLVVYSNFDDKDGKRHIAGTICDIAG